jgi:NADH dehydrogenase FAD-containing subunit
MSAKRVVVLGGGFGGLAAARVLRGSCAAAPVGTTAAESVGAAGRGD